MKKINSIIWGVALVAVGVMFALNALEVTSINIFFDGWWTLFIIIPCFVGLFTEREKTGNIIGLLIGIALLLGCRDIISFALLWKLFIPAVIVVVGVKMLIGGIFGSKERETIDEIKKNSDNVNTYTATFSGSNINYDAQVFEGAELNAIFGGLELHLENAVIERDCLIELNAIFGGIDIRVPADVNVKVNPTCIFGGISNKTEAHDGAPTIYIKATCMFGGANIR